MIYKSTIQNSGCGCSTSNSAASTCPKCQINGISVKEITIKSQLKKEFLETTSIPLDEFNFCTNPECDTVYYSKDGSESFDQASIKSKVTLKNNDPKTPLCYCKKLLKENVIKMIEDKEENIAKKVKAIIADGKSFCEKSNPKGVCCTEDVKVFLSEYGIDWDEPKTSLFSVNPPQSSCC